MHSSRSALALVLALGACGTDVSSGTAADPVCTTSVLTYENFGAPFLLDWCRGCHSSTQPVGMRQDAPMGVDFDDLGRVRDFAATIELRATGLTPNMPPAAGPSPEERAMLKEWITCGAR